MAGPNAIKLKPVKPNPLLFSQPTMSDSFDEQAGDVSSKSFNLPLVPHHHFTGCPRVPEINLDTVHQIVGLTPPIHHHSQLLRSIASVSGDLSSLTAPPFILSPVSLTEFPGAPKSITSSSSLIPLSLQHTGANAQSSSQI